MDIKQLENDGHWEWKFSASQDLFTSEWDKLDTIADGNKTNRFYNMAGFLMKVVHDGLKKEFTTYLFVEKEEE